MLGRRSCSAAEVPQVRVGSRAASGQLPGPHRRSSVHQAAAALRAERLAQARSQLAGLRDSSAEALQADQVLQASALDSSAEDAADAETATECPLPCALLPKVPHREYDTEAVQEMRWRF